MKFKSRRGYSAIARAITEDRVIYDSWDEQGERMQINGCRAPKDFYRDWAPK